MGSRLTDQSMLMEELRIPEDEAMEAGDVSREDGLAWMFQRVAEEQEEREAVEELRLAQEEYEAGEEGEDVSLEDGLVWLFQRFAEMREEFPAEYEDCDWYSMDPEVRTELALARVEEVFHRVFEEEATALEYPTLGVWNNVQYDPGYGLRPVEVRSGQVSRIRGNSLQKFLHVLNVMRNLLQSDTRTTKRDIYYQHVRDFSSQREVDRLVSIAVAMLEVS